MEVLSAQSIRHLVLEGLYKPSEINPETNEPYNGTPVIIEGMYKTIGFNPDRLNNIKQDIIALAKQLPPPAFLVTGSGLTYGELLVNGDGDVWGTEHDIDELVILCLAINICVYNVRKDYLEYKPQKVLFNLNGFHTEEEFDLLAYDYGFVPNEVDLDSPFVKKCLAKDTSEKE